MNKILRVFISGLLILATYVSNAQGINFQGVARSANGTILASSSISLRLSVLSKSVDATPEYVETKKVVTNAQGIFSIIIGDGVTATVGTFKNVNWAEAPKFLKVEMDPSGGTSYINMGITQLQYVPYSFYSLGVAADNVTGVLSVAKGGTGVGSLDELKTALKITSVDTTSLSKRIDSKLTKGDTASLSSRIEGNLSLIGGLKNKSNYLIDSLGNIGLGVNALSKTQYRRDTAGIGFIAPGANILPQNIAIGDSALQQNTSGAFNIAIGTKSLSKITNTGDNTALGFASLLNLTSQNGGWANTALGTTTLMNNQNGNVNVAIGSGSMERGTTGSFNTATGVESLIQNNGNYNAAFGLSSLHENTTGDNNTALGNNAGYTNTTGSLNTFIGNQADASIGGLTNVTAIGNGAIVSTSNTIQLGNTSVTNVKTSGAITAKKYTNIVANTLNFTTGTNNIDLSLSNIYTVNLNGNVNLTFSNGTPGSYIIKLIQDTVGSRTVSFPSSNWKWASNSSTSVSTYANSINLVNVIFDGTNYYATMTSYDGQRTSTDPNVTISGSSVTLSGRITTDVKLYAKDINYLSGIVYMTKGTTLTIEAGAKILAKSGVNVASLVICRGAKIIANGTAENPIVFTSSSSNPQSGDWGGVVLCGTATVNQSLTWKGTSYMGLASVEGGINDVNVGYGLFGSGDTEFPTGNDSDNSGTLRYVRIEYAGYAYLPDNELNSLTLAGIGTGTTIDHIQTTYAKDDAFEWFGGTVNCKYLVAYKTQDDDFDATFGYRGNVQFGIALRDSAIADISRSEAFESDNDGNGSDRTPKTSAVFSNMTVIGPRINPDYSRGNSLFYAGAQLRRNSGISIQNSIIAGWPRGITIDESLVTTNGSTFTNLQDSIIRFKNVTLAGNTVDFEYIGKTGASTNKTTADVLAIFSNAYYNNTILNSSDPSVLKLIQPFNYTNPDFTPYASAGPSGNINAALVYGNNIGSLGLGASLNYTSNGDFSDSKLQNAFFDRTATFRGAVATSGVNQSWWKGWTVWK